MPLLHPRHDVSPTSHLATFCSGDASCPPLITSCIASAGILSAENPSSPPSLGMCDTTLVSNMSALCLGPLSNQCSFHVDARKLKFLDAYTEDKETTGNKNQMPQKKGGEKEMAANVRAVLTPSVTKCCWHRMSTTPSAADTECDWQQTSLPCCGVRGPWGRARRGAPFFPFFRRRSK